MKYKILVCGAGSIGIYLGTLLHTAGQEVCLYGRRKLKEIGDTVYINDKLYNLPKRIFELPANQSFDVIFITAKLYDLENILKSVKTNKLSCTMVVTIQNGLVDQSNYKNVVICPLLIMSVFEGFRLEKSHLHVSTTSLGWRTHATAEGKIVSELLTSAGIHCEADENLDSVRAEKSIVNCCLNALSTVKNKPISELFKDHEAEAQISRLFDESYNIICAYYHLPSREEVRNKMYSICSKMDHFSSTHQDFYSGRQTEIEFLNGYLIKLGKEKGLPTTENELILGEFRKLQSLSNIPTFSRLR